MKKYGFTLIELLVVISIIAILAALSLVGVSGAQKQARDAQRRSDLDQYKLALESYAASNNGKYPSYAAATAVIAGTLYTDYLTDQMSSTLTDPRTSGACADAGTPGKIYCYFEDVTVVNTSATAANYILYVGLETGGWWEICGLNNSTKGGKTGKVSAVPTDTACDVP